MSKRVRVEGVCALTACAGMMLPFLARWAYGSGFWGRGRAQGDVTGQKASEDARLCCFWLQVRTCLVLTLMFFILYFFQLFEKIWKNRQISLRDLWKFKNLRDFGLLTLFRKNCWNSWEFSSKFVNSRQLLGKISELVKIHCANAKTFDEIWRKFWMLSGAKACKSCRSLQELSKEYGPLKVCQKLATT